MGSWQLGEIQRLHGSEVLSEATKYTCLSSTPYIHSFSKGIMVPSAAEWSSEVGAWLCFPDRRGVGSAGPCIFRTSGAPYMRIQWSHQNQKFHRFQLTPPGSPTTGLAALRGRKTFSLVVEEFTLEGGEELSWWSLGLSASWLPWAQVAPALSCSWWGCSHSESCWVVGCWYP